MSDSAVVESGTRLQNFLDRAGLRGFPWKTATILYKISWGWLFIVHDSLWADDWHRFPKHGAFTWDSHGFAPWLRYETVLFDLVGLTGSRVLIFGTFFISGLLLFAISANLIPLSVEQRKLLVFLFLATPFNTARVSLQCIHYSNSFLLFFFAWYILISYKSRKTFFLSMVLFFLSFGMHSLLPFYSLPVLHKLLLSKVGSARQLFAFTRRNALAFLLPVMYWGVRSVFWPEEVSYHDVSLTDLLRTTKFVLVLGGLLVVIFALQIRLKAKKNSLQIIFAGIICMFFGIYAYIIYGFFSPNWSFFSKYIETFLGRSDWYSRHQTLQPLGLALLIVGVIGVLPKFLGKFSKQIQAFILSVCVVFNVGFGFEYVVDHSKQKEIINALIVKRESKPESNYQFVDQTTLLNARGRSYRDRDWQGLIWLAYGVESMRASQVSTSCESFIEGRFVLIRGPKTHWEALRNWVSDGDMGFVVMVDDTPGACKPQMVTTVKVSGAIPILFYFTGAKG